MQKNKLTTKKIIITVMLIPRLPQKVDFSDRNKYSKVPIGQHEFMILIYIYNVL